ncbi:MAG TPA: alpha-L-fucosidase [Candidatus Acidoferrum sp.]|nr:alpha-L-fucosidase [Candidatus Acidoferrum sp.]
MKQLLILGTLAALLPLAQAQTNTTSFTNQTDKTETKAQRDARMAWWRDAKFGLFIHWGVYSVPAGYYHGQPVAGIGEWIMNKGKIPMAEYQQFAKEFNPTNFNADEWVKTAKDAGMKYIVITSKHHDGFAMFCSQASQWNICDASPFGRDPLQELAAACRKQGIRLGFYYSQAQDWNNGGSAAGGKWDPAQQHSMDDYIDHIAVPQVREILTRYGPDIPAVLWWDTPTGMNRERAQKLYQITQELRPDLIQNNRLGGGFKGDIETPEQHIPAQGYPGRDWETCMTMNDTWGFKRDDNHWKSTGALIRNLCDIASKGGNYLLNVGPMSDGVIPPPSVTRLAEIGGWMRTNGEAIYGTGPTAFGAEAGKLSETDKDQNGKPRFVTAWDWRCTTKPGKIYLLIFKWPLDGNFGLPAVTNEITRAYLLADPKRHKLKFKQNSLGVSLALPAKAPDAIASVVCLETK